MFRKSVGLDRTVESISSWGLSYGYGDREMDMVCLILIRIRGGNVVRRPEEICGSNGFAADVLYHLNKRYNLKRS
eukprot:scaffold22140_cov86-Skeletonema_menzelii.AAC.2